MPKFLTKICGYDPQLIAYFQNSTEAYFGVGIDGTTAARRLGQLESGLRRHGSGRTGLSHHEHPAGAWRSPTPTPISSIFPTAMPVWRGPSSAR